MAYLSTAGVIVADILTKRGSNVLVLLFNFVKRDGNAVAKHARSSSDCLVWLVEPPT